MRGGGLGQLLWGIVLKCTPVDTPLPWTVHPSSLCIPAGDQRLHAAVRLKSQGFQEPMESAELSEQGLAVRNKDRQMGLFDREMHINSVWGRALGKQAASHRTRRVSQIHCDSCEILSPLCLEFFGHQCHGGLSEHEKERHSSLCPLPHQVPPTGCRLVFVHAVWLMLLV